MKRVSKSILIVIILDIIVFSLCVLGIYLISLKIGLPIKFSVSNSSLIVKQVDSNISKISVGDKLISINGQRLSSQEEIEVFLDGLEEYTPIKLDFEKNGNQIFEIVQPIKFYSLFYLIIVTITGILFFFIGIFVFLKKPGNTAAKLFHWVIIGTTSIIMMTWGSYSFSPHWLGYFLRILFSFAYTISPALFVHFTLKFPEEKKINYNLVLKILYLIALIISSLASLSFLELAVTHTVQAKELYLIFFNLCRLFMILCIVSGLIIFIHSYKTAESEPERKKLRWILFGFVIGPLGFISLWVIPQAITSYGLIPEEFIILLMTAIPLTFAISIVKYHALDIDLIIKRSIIYFIAVAVLILVYTGMVVTVTSIVRNVSELISSTVAAIIIAFLFQPAKSIIQKAVDKKFFRTQYDFRIATKNFFNEIKNCGSIKILASKIVEQSNLLLPMTRIGFFIYDPMKSRIRLAAHHNFNLLEDRSIYLNVKELKTDLTLPVAVPDKTESTINIEEADNKVFRRWGIVLVIPIKSSIGELLGFLVLGEKKSGKRFTIEDVDLLLEVTLQAGLTLEKIKIHEELIREQLVKEKFEELSRLKSFFISSISHELKTPLTSIKMFSELLLLKKNFYDKESEDYLEIITGECSRLERLIENVLDLSKIERGVKEYKFAEVELKTLLCNAMNLMSYQFKIEKCTVEQNICGDDCLIFADSDAVIGAIINILSNGIKYSSEPKRILISLKKENGFIFLKFKNYGQGIAAEELHFIAQPYFRSQNTKNKNIPGSGLGLALVQQIMSAHNGSLEIQSTPGKDCSFSLVFPLMKKEDISEKNIVS